MCNKIFRSSISLLFIVLIFKSSNAYSGTLHQVCFNPGLCCKENIVELCDRAQSSIELVLYRFTDRDIYSAIINAYERGVHIVVIIDGVNLLDKAGPSYGLIKDLVAKGCIVYTSSRHKVIHHRFAIFDHKALVTGSYNWTYGGMKNHEDCILVSDSEVVNEYGKYIQSLFAKGDLVRISR